MLIDKFPNFFSLLRWNVPSGDPFANGIRGCVIKMKGKFHQRTWIILGPTLEHLHFVHGVFFISVSGHIQVNSHTELKHEALYLLGSRPDTICWINEVGTAHAYFDRFKNIDDRKVIRYGLKGSHDILGFTQILGVAIFLGCEIKFRKDVQRESQINFEKRLLAFGGISLLYRGDKDQLIKDFEDARNRCSAIICAHGNESIPGSRS